MCSETDPLSKKLENLVLNDPEFIKAVETKPRRGWQRGDSPREVTFTYTAQVFVRPFGYDMEKLKNPPYDLHPWVRDVVVPKNQSAVAQDFYANPFRPEIWDCRTGVMTRIKNASPPFLQKGDIVWISFHVEFIIGANTWVPQFTPRHIIRVADMPSLLIDALTTVEEGKGGEPEPDYSIEEGATIVIRTSSPSYAFLAALTKYICVFMRLTRS